MALMQCDNEHGVPADLVITNQHTGDVTAVCLACFPGFALPMVEAIMETAEAPPGQVVDNGAESAQEAGPAATPEAQPRGEPEGVTTPAGPDGGAEASAGAAAGEH